MEFTRENAQVVAGVAGRFVRFAFYAVGVFALLFVGLLAFWTWNRLPPSRESVKAQPAFEIRTSSLSGRPQLRKAENWPQGWVESLQYGQLYDRDVDMTIMMIVPNDTNQTFARDYAREIAALRPISGRRYQTNTPFYDLETRFGSIRANEFSINADGRTKLCISYLSRFDTAAVYLKGWYCEANGARPNFGSVACVLDQLVLGRPLRSAEATAFMTERMKLPGKCFAEPVTQTTDNSPRKPLKRLIR